MIIVDRHGRKITTSTKLSKASLAEKLLSVGTLIPGSILDKTGIIFVHLDEEEEKSFMEYYKQNFWVKTYENEEFNPITQDFDKALESIVSGINKNRTNAWGRFISCKAVIITPDPMSGVNVYGWIYVPTPQDNIITFDKKKISINFFH